MCGRCKPLIKAIDRYLAKADEDLVGTLGAEGYVNSKETVDTINEIEDEVTDALKKQTENIKSGISSSKSLASFAIKWDEIKDADGLDEEIEAIFSTKLKEFIPKYAGYYIQKTDRELVCSRLSLRSQAWIEDWSAELGAIMKLNTHEEIQAVLDKGLKDGTGIEEFARQILDGGIRDERFKARRVSLTEVLTAHRVAQQEAFEQSPSVKEKEWMHTGSYKNEPRENHMDMDGQRVPVDSPFDLTGADGFSYYPMYPGDTILPAGERINCHCIAKPIVDDDILGMPLEERQRLQEEALDELDADWERELDEQNRAKAGIEVEDA